MRKTTYIHGLTLRYCCNVIDRTGVEQANAAEEIADELAQSGYDQQGNWHGSPKEWRGKSRRCSRFLFVYFVVVCLIIGGLIAVLR
jgi:hypothetical protein